MLPELSAEQGYSLRIPEFVVPSGREAQNCYFVRLPDLDDGQDVWVNRISLRMNSGSHHMNVFRVKTIVGLVPEAGEPIGLGDYSGTVVYGSDDHQNNPCWASANWADWPLVTNTEVPDPPDWQLPEGVATRFSPGEMLMVQTHYVNTSIQPTPSGQGRVAINFHRTPTAPGLQELGTLFATQQSIRVCQSYPTPTFSGTCRFPHAVTIAAANGHFHSRGREFQMFAWDGQTTNHPSQADRFYDSKSWSNPPMTTGLATSVAEGGGIWWDCAYRWTAPVVYSCDEVNTKDPEQQGDCCYTFGGNTDVGEHCNAFVYYYPKLENASDVFCN
ncbi:MAG TPA: hypothetical protein VG937_38215 [Polyangiaceae bacterium]|nr:hypothetical protein [Polyangiaceae bacterium]